VDAHHLKGARNLLNPFAACNQLHHLEQVDLRSGNFSGVTFSDGGGADSLSAKWMMVALYQYQFR